jgi:hypothetical protein
MILAFAGLAALASAAIEPPRPGWNLFSPKQDVQLGKEAQSQVERQMHVVHNSEVSRYLSSLGQKLARSRYAGNWPYSFGLVEDKSINAFSLPGGPIYVNTGLIEAADNEAQLAGVLAHEMSHIALRHGTNQASKANLIQIPAMIAGGILGQGGGMLGQLAGLGIGLGANSVLLKFSRGAESQADYNGALIMADAGYNPIEMARFFEKLEAQDGRSGGLAEFLSDHPDPGNRVRAVENEIRQLPQREYRENSGQFPRIKDLVTHLPDQGRLNGSYSDQHPAQPPAVRPSNRFRQYQTDAYSLGYPDNWETFGDASSPAVTIAPRDAIFNNSSGEVTIGYGMMVSYYFPRSGQANLDRDTDSLIRELQNQNTGMAVEGRRRVIVDGLPALLTTMHARSPYQGEREMDALVTVARPQGLFYLVFISPQSEWTAVQGVLEEMLRTVRFQ